MATCQHTNPQPLPSKERVKQYGPPLVCGLPAVSRVAYFTPWCPTCGAGNAACYCGFQSNQGEGVMVLPLKGEVPTPPAPYVINACVDHAASRLCSTGEHEANEGVVCSC